MTDILERTKRTPRYRYSWKKPYLFESFREMISIRDEREVYKKIGVIERHSSFKKPYWNPGTHRQGELYYSPPGFPTTSRPNVDVTTVDPGGSQTGGNVLCGMACLGGILDCKNGGCDRITCICGKAPYIVEILEDPTGKASVVNGLTPMVCIEPTGELNDRYATIVAKIVDSDGQKDTVDFPLVNCSGCCDSFTLSGSSTVNPGATWEGTIAPCCGDIEVSVAIDCGPVTTSLSPDGCTVWAMVGDSACGTFYVTVTATQPDCTVQTATLGVRINNTGQGGAWAYDQNSSQLGMNGCSGCGCGGSIQNYGTYCFDGEYKYGGFNVDPAHYCEGTVVSQCQGDGASPCTPCGGEDGVDICGWGGPGCGPPLADCTRWSWWRCNWECSC